MLFFWCTKINWIFSSMILFYLISKGSRNTSLNKLKQKRSMHVPNRILFIKWVRVLCNICLVNFVDRTQLLQCENNVNRLVMKKWIQCPNKCVLEKIVFAKNLIKTYTFIWAHSEGILVSLNAATGELTLPSISWS